MKKMLIICCMAINVVYAQHIPDYGLNKIRITEEQMTLLIETNPVAGNVKASPLKSYYWYSANAVHYTQGGFSGKLLNGIYKSFYLNKNLKEEGEFDNGLKSGLWKNWADNGLLIETINWKKGIKHGPFTTYTDFGKPLISGNYRDGLYHGKVRSFGKDSVTILNYDNGTIAPKKIPLLKKINIFRKKPKPTAVI